MQTKKFQKEKIKHKPLPRARKEENESNPWGGHITPALQAFIDERRAKEKSLRESRKQDSKS